MYEIYVFGIEGEQIGGGWVLYTRTSSREIAYKRLNECLAKYGQDNVDWDFIN